MDTHTDPFVETEQAPAGEAVAAPEQISADEARELGYTPEEIQALRDAGIIEDRLLAPWRPTDLAGVAWVVRKLKTIDAEIEEIEAQTQRQVQQLLKAREALLDRFGEECKQITLDHLPKTKSGAYAKKSIDIPATGCRAKITSRRGGPRVKDEAALLAFIREHRDEHPVLVECVRATVTEVFEGEAALVVLDDPDLGAKPKLAHDPVKAYVATLPGIPVEETGELLPATLPGVELEPATETWSWE